MEEITQLTKEMVRFKTVKGEKQEINSCFDYIRDYFSGEEFVIWEFENDGVETLVIGFEETKTPEILLHGHIDVVPAEDEMFDPEVRDRKIYGRGAGDMKSGVACLMKVMKDLKEEKPDIALMLVSDEETGGFNGAGYIVEEGFRPDFAISAEPNNTRNYMDIVMKQKGVVNATIAVNGRSAHASRPWKGENAAEKLMEIYMNRLKPLFPDNSTKTWETTMNLGEMKAGDASNKVADRAEMKLDVRWSEDFRGEEVKEEFEAIDELEVQSWLNEPMLETDSEDDYVQLLKDSCEEEGFQPDVTRKEAASDMRHFSGKGIPAVVFGPEAYNSHEPGEYAVIDSFSDYVTSLKKFVRRVEG
jgi:succinyl-diaminopimelate desuccinylase